jgi:hypothetical protein
MIRCGSDQTHVKKRGPSFLYICLIRTTSNHWSLPFSNCSNLQFQIMLGLLIVSWKKSRMKLEIFLRAFIFSIIQKMYKEVKMGPTQNFEFYFKVWV